MTGPSTEDERTEREATADGGGAEPEGRKLTQRMREELVEDLDAFAADQGRGPNGAINMLAKTGLRDF